MASAIFGITNDGLNLVVNLLILMLVVVWLAMIVYTYLDARRRLSDPFLIACATIASFFPYIGTAVYAIVRPPEFLEDAHERELEIKAAELRVRQLVESSCPNCEYPVEKSYLRCPNCQKRLKDPCPSCGKPVAPRWEVCPFCETTLRARPRQKRRATEEGRRPPRREAPRKDASAPPPPPRETRAPSEPGGEGGPRGGESPRGTQRSARRTAALQEPPPGEDAGERG